MCITFAIIMEIKSNLKYYLNLKVSIFSSTIIFLVTLIKQFQQYEILIPNNVRILLKKQDLSEYHLFINFINYTKGSMKHDLWI